MNMDDDGNDAHGAHEDGKSLIAVALRSIITL